MLDCDPHDLSTWIARENRNARDGLSSVQTGLPLKVGAVSVLGAIRERQSFIEAANGTKYGLHALTTLHTTC
jgi:hypothetical protein